MQNYAFSLIPHRIITFFKAKIGPTGMNRFFAPSLRANLLPVGKKCPILKPVIIRKVLELMENHRKGNGADGDKDIVFSKVVRAGKRIYYLDVKKNRKEEMYVSVTESKKVVSGEGPDAQVSFEKHKIFLYKEDLRNFTESLQEVMRYVMDGEEPAESPDDIDLDISF